MSDKWEGNYQGATESPDDDVRRYLAGHCPTCGEDLLRNDPHQPGCAKEAYDNAEKVFGA